MRQAEKLLLRSYHLLDYDWTLLHFSFFGAVVGHLPNLAKAQELYAIRASWILPLSAPELRREKNLASHHHHHDAISTAP